MRRLLSAVVVSSALSFSFAGAAFAAATDWPAAAGNAYNNAISACATSQGAGCQTALQALFSAALAAGMTPAQIGGNVAGLTADIETAAPAGTVVDVAALNTAVAGAADASGASGTGAGGPAGGPGGPTPASAG